MADNNTTTTMTSSPAHEKLDSVTRDAQEKSREAWMEASQRMGSERVNLEKRADEAHFEAQVLQRKAQTKSDEAARFRKESESLESAEAAMAAKADVAAKPPGIGDRLRAGMDSVKDKLERGFRDTSKSVRETGDRASAKYNESMASIKEGAAETMANTANKEADIAQRWMDSADKNRENADIARDKYTESRVEREKERERTVEFDDDTGSTTQLIKEKLSGTAENAAERIGESARDTESSMGERRRDAQLAQGKVPERI